MMLSTYVLLFNSNTRQLMLVFKNNFDDKIKIIKPLQSLKNNDFAKIKPCLTFIVGECIL